MVSRRFNPKTDWHFSSLDPISVSKDLTWRLSISRSSVFTHLPSWQILYTLLSRLSFRALFTCTSALILTTSIQTLPLLKISTQKQTNWDMHLLHRSQSYHQTASAEELKTSHPAKLDLILLSSALQLKLMKITYIYYK